MHGYVGNFLYIEEHGFSVRTLNAILDAFHEYVCVCLCVLVVVVVRDSCQNYTCGVRELSLRNELLQW